MVTSPHSMVLIKSNTLLRCRGDRCVSKERAGRQCMGTRPAPGNYNIARQC